MRAECCVFIATSLDGFIARPNGSLDWLDRVNERVPAGEDCGFREFLATIDALVMGRRSFETVAGFPDWPYGSTPVHILSSSLKRASGRYADRVKISDESPGDCVSRLTAGGARRIYVDGGETIRRFLRESLIDEMTITRVSVLIGQGVPLFGALETDIPLRHVETRVYPFGHVQSRYRLVREIA